MISPEQDIVIIGSGNVATHLASALSNAGHTVSCVFSRTADRAAALARKVNATAVTAVADLPKAQTYIYCVTDAVLPGLAEEISRKFPDGLHIHTSGSTDMAVFSSRHYGVLYPLQTFSKAASLNFNAIPCFVEGNNDDSLKLITEMAASLSRNVRPLDSTGRRHLHLAAVFAANFTNHCYALAAEILAHGANLPFDVLLPLIDETARKVHDLAPVAAQTGPAVRHDANILSKHLQLLAGDALRQDIYRQMSHSIYALATADQD